MPTYHLTLTYEGQTHTFTKHLNHDASITEDEVRQSIINDFYGNFGLEITPIQSHAADTRHDSTGYIGLTRNEG